MQSATLDMDLSNVSQLFNMMIAPTKQIIYYAALYLRLSRDDNNGNSESMSIQSQREMLISYANSKRYEVVEVYVDDGYTGTNLADVR